MTRTIVMLGGGYVTLHAYRQLRHRLRREIRRGAIELVVISADDAHSFHGFTGEVLAGLLPVARTRTPLTMICPDARLIHAVATAVDPGRRTVGYRLVGAETSAEICYDQLIVGTGGREPVAQVPGLREFGHTLRSPGDLDRLAAVVDHLIAGSAGPPARVVVAGGGLAGVEIAAAIADRGRGRVGVDLVHSGQRLLPALRAAQPRLARRGERELDRLGVRVHRAVRLATVTAGGVVLSDGTVLPADAVLGTIGQRPVPLPGLDVSHRDAVGRLITSADLSVTEGVWAAGDAARVCHPRTGDPVPATALWAIKGGAHLGRNVARLVQGHPTRPFRYRGLGQAASFGIGRSIAELYGIPFTGALAWALRLTFFLRFLPDRSRVPAVLADVARCLGGRRIGPDGQWVRRQRRRARQDDRPPVPAGDETVLPDCQAA